MNRVRFININIHVYVYVYDLCLCLFISAVRSHFRLGSLLFFSLVNSRPFSLQSLFNSRLPISWLYIRLRLRFTLDLAPNRHISPLGFSLAFSGLFMAFAMLPCFAFASPLSLWFDLAPIIVPLVLVFNLV